MMLVLKARLGRTMSALNIIRTFRESRERRSLLEKIREFKPRQSIYYESEDFIVKTAEVSAELLSVLELRHEIFVRQWQGRTHFSGLDADEFDFLGDHLLIINKADNKIVGTYRVLCSHFTQEFYSQSEFILDQFLQWPSVKLELGRACIHNEYRNGNTIDLLWKGLSRYIKSTEARYLFGCASIKSVDMNILAALYKDFAQKNLWTDEYQLRPVSKYRFPQAIDIEQTQSSKLSKQELRDLIPPLLRSYFHAGAKVYGQPAWDKVFACTDLLTILDMSALNTKFKQRYFPSH